jgi:taurine dioxygenase
MNKEIYRHSVSHTPQFGEIAYDQFELEPLTGALGAEITGLDVVSRLDDELVAEALRLALSRHLVLVFRNQEMDKQHLRRFGQIFGQLHANPVVKKHADSPDVMLVKQEADEKYNFAGNWHSDVTWDKNPCGESVLYALDVPPWGGDTHFANTALAFETLSDELKSMLSGLKAVHELESSQREFAAKKQADADLPAEIAQRYVAEHPVVRRHPVTGANTLFVNEQFTTRFVGMTEEESRSLLETLYRHQIRPDFTCRIRWKKGTLALWDNRTTIHYASNDYPNIRRVMMRVSTVGEEPLG